MSNHKVGDIVYFFDYDILDVVKARIKTPVDTFCRVALISDDGCEGKDIIKAETTLYTSARDLWMSIIADTELDLSFAVGELKRAKAAQVRLTTILQKARSALNELAVEQSPESGVDHANVRA